MAQHPLQTHPWPRSVISTQRDREAKGRPVAEIHADRKKQPSSPKPTHVPSAITGWGPPGSPLKSSISQLCVPVLLGHFGVRLGQGGIGRAPPRTNHISGSGAGPATPFTGPAVK